MFLPRSVSSPEEEVASVYSAVDTYVSDCSYRSIDLIQAMAQCVSVSDSTVLYLWSMYVS